ncbi:MAG: DnaJ domain-containing protein [Crocinitomicaceae bacterium]
MSKRLNSLRNEFGCAYAFVLFVYIWIIIMKEGPVDYVGLGIMVLVIYAVIFYSHRMRKKSKAKKRDYQFLFDESEASIIYLELVTAVVKVDGHSDKELKYLTEIMHHYFSEKRAQYILGVVHSKLDDPPIDVKAHCAEMIKEFDTHSIVQLMHLLVGICVTDAYLTKKENKILRQIAVELKVPFSTYNQILLMYRFKFEGAKKRTKKTSYSSRSQLLAAYGILEITQDASVEEIKKAYRQLAVQHHPDKVIHLGEEMQKSAKEKFQIIAEAYELIKEKKGFS